MKAFHALGILKKLTSNDSDTVALISHKTILIRYVQLLFTNKIEGGADIARGKGSENGTLIVG